MRLNEKLRELDERATHEQRPSSWARSTRSWWLDVAFGFAAFGGMVLLDIPALGFFAVPAGFAGGFFYNERLRQLGRRSLNPGFRAPSAVAPPDADL